ncbi:GntR family transcriptional regulator [Streptomyces sp. DSM 44917]|uniref:GntR family transcriptional regulator n=1 Tax=Streptomyces boetiae TaxID=3075541 RepID=A0ABU2L4D4_9ACTN|nr:GntR family transcriptional regulator [Streptomyces sp. DSM 44917]MDT0306098.1 GntR family transcriptional regulator [Streptomyces sp. DSM 44917]
MDDELGGPLDLTGPEYVYVQIAERIAAQIAAGRFPPGARLPSERELAERFGVSYGTVRRATDELRERGLIRTVHGRGTYITQPPADDEG